MTTRAKILLINLLVLLAYTLYFLTHSVRYPLYIHNDLEFQMEVIFCLCCHSILIIGIAVNAGRWGKDWWLALLMVLLIGFSTCLGGTELLHSRLGHSLAVPRGEDGAFIDQ